MTNKAINHIVTANEALAIMQKHNVKTYKQHNHQGKTLAAYELQDGQLIDITEREKIREEIEEQQRVLRHLQMAAVRAAKTKEDKSDA